MSFTIRPNIILYRTISNDFAETLALKKKEKLCEERRFGVLKTLKIQELPGALPPGPPTGRCPWTPPGALERAPEPHAVKTLRSLRSTWTQTIFIQHPSVTNPAHAHVLGSPRLISLMAPGMFQQGDPTSYIIKKTSWTPRRKALSRCTL